MTKFNPYGYGRCTSRDEFGNADIKGVDMTFLLSLPYKEMVLVTTALNRLADFEDAVIVEDKHISGKDGE